VDDARGALMVKLQRSVFAALFVAALALLAVLSQRHSTALDWTDSGRNTLSAASASLLARMPGPIHVRAFVSRNERLREAVRQLVDRYERAHPSVTVEFIDPQREPRMAERYRVSKDGELIIEYGERHEKVQGLSEATLTNALARLARQGSGWLAWLEGGGARDLNGASRRDLGNFSAHLRSLGIQVQALSLANVTHVPENVELLLVPQPAEEWPNAAAAAVRDYLGRGGNLLWLADPGGPRLGALEELLGVAPESGLLVDPGSRLDGRPTPEFVVVSSFASHPVAAALSPFAAFPTATSLAWEAREGWQVRGLAATGLRAWRETGNLDQAVSFDADEDVPGPLDLAVALQRPSPKSDASQRVLVFGDADFLSNAYLGLGANRTLGSNAVNWLSDDAQLVDVPSVMAPDLDFAPGQPARALIALGAPLLLPLGLLGFGLARWRRRRGR